MDKITEEQAKDFGRRLAARHLRWLGGQGLGEHGQHPDLRTPEAFIGVQMELERQVGQPVWFQPSGPGWSLFSWDDKGVTVTVLASATRTRQGALVVAFEEWLKK